MANYLYNGVNLPEAPTVDGYPHMIICSVVGNYPLYCWASQPTTSVHDNGYNYVECGNSTFFESTFWGSEGADTWDEIEEQGGGGSFPLSDILWANFDIYAPDGTLYLAASEPVPIGGAFPLHAESFLKGLEIGKLLKKKRFERGSEPDVPTTAAYCLYNGVKLPNIDTVWTEELKQTHPYAYITHLKYVDETDSIDALILYLSDAAAYHNSLVDGLYMIPTYSKVRTYQFVDQ